MSLHLANNRGALCGNSLLAITDQTTSRPIEVTCEKCLVILMRRDENNYKQLSDEFTRK